MTESIRFHTRTRNRVDQLRCPYCHDEIGPDVLRRCPACDACYHEDCAEACVILGCQSVLEPQAPERQPKAPWLVTPPFLLGALLAGLGFVLDARLLLSLGALAAEIGVLILVSRGLAALYRRYALPAYLRARGPTPAKMARRSSIQPPSKLRADQDRQAGP